jgi:hypothetical protein
VTIESAIDESMSHEERAVVALESIAEALTSWCKLEQQRFEKEYPVKQAREAIVTHVQTEEERLRQEQGDTGESLEEWVGPREQAILSRKK